MVDQERGSYVASELGRNLPLSKYFGLKGKLFIWYSLELKRVQFPSMEYVSIKHLVFKKVGRFKGKIVAKIWKFGNTHKEINKHKKIPMY